VVRLELQFGRVGIAGALLLAHLLLLFGLFTIARRPTIPPTPISTVSFITSTTEVRQWQPQQVQANAADVALPMPVAPPIETSTSITAAPEGISAPAETPEPVIVASPREQGPKVVESVQYLREPVIRYPTQSRRWREQGVVLFQVLVDERGIPVEVEVERSSGYTRLDEAGREAVLQSRFRPYTENGVARSVFVLVPLRFTLKRR
jgi:protein TonB